MKRAIQLFKYRGKGFTLVEVLVAVALLALVGVAILASLGGASKVLLKTDLRETARNLAEAQMEYIQNAPYKTTDPTGIPVFYDKLPNLSTSYPGYDVEVHAARIDKGSGITNDTGIQEITIVVEHSTNTVFTLVGMKVKR